MGRLGECLRALSLASSRTLWRRRKEKKKREGAVSFFVTLWRRRNEFGAVSLFPVDGRSKRRRFFGEFILLIIVVHDTNYFTCGFFIVNMFFTLWHPSASQQGLIPHMRLNENAILNKNSSLR